MPGRISIDGDSAFYLDTIGGNPGLLLDTASGASWIDFDRTNDRMRLIVNGSVRWYVEATGQMAGTGFYASGAASLANGASVDLTHGLGARPRFVWGWSNTTSLAAAADSSATANFPIRDDSSPASSVYWSYAHNTQIRIGNNTGVTAYYTVCAML